MAWHGISKGSGFFIALITICCLYPFLTYGDELDVQKADINLSLTHIDASYSLYNPQENSVTINMQLDRPITNRLSDSMWDEEKGPTLQTKPRSMQIMIDGKPVRFKKQQVALYQDADVTALLQENHIPLVPDVISGHITLNKEDPEAVNHWLDRAGKLGLINDEGQPVWQVQDQYYWQQQIPKSGTQQTHIVYQPNVYHYAATRSTDQNEQRWLRANQKLCESNTESFNCKMLFKQPQVQAWLREHQQIYFYQITYPFSMEKQMNRIDQYVIHIDSNPDSMMLYNSSFAKAIPIKQNNDNDVTLQFNSFEAKKDLQIVWLTPQAQ